MFYGFNVATNFQYVGTPWYKNVTMYFSKDGGITPYASLSNPFPVGFVGPPGPKYGKLAQWGFDNGYNLNDGLRNAEIYQWNIGIQRELPANILVEVNYSANRSTHLPFNGYDGTRNRNFLSRADRDKYGSDGLAELVDNPFYPFFRGPNAIFNEPDSLYNDPQIQRSYLLRPYPQFAGSFGGYPQFIANSRYNSLQVRFEKRYSYGLAFTGNYTYAHMVDDNSLGFNPWVGTLQATGELQDLTNLSAEKGVSGFDTPHRLAFAVTYDLPVGKGRPLGRNMNRALDAIVGGWKTNAFVTLQSGTPLGIHMADNRLADGNQRPNVSGNPKVARAYGTPSMARAFTSMNPLSLIPAIKRSATRRGTFQVFVVTESRTSTFPYSRISRSGRVCICSSEPSFSTSLIQLGLGTQVHHLGRATLESSRPSPTCRATDKWVSVSCGDAMQSGSAGQLGGSPRSRRSALFSVSVGRSRRPDRWC